MLRTLICHEEMVRKRNGPCKDGGGLEGEVEQDAHGALPKQQTGKGNTRREEGKSCGAKKGIKEKETYRDSLYRREKKTLRLQK